jgi:P pilus assembly chaperone PapD
VAFLAALILCSGLALAASLTRTINVNFYEPLAISVSPELAANLDVPYSGSASTTYTVTNATPSLCSVVCTYGSLPTGVSVDISPAEFDLTAGQSQEVLVTVTNTSGTPADASISLSFTPGEPV